MSKVSIYNLKGETVGEQELSSEVFGVSLNSKLIHQVVTAQLSNRRAAIAHTKDRSEVRGGGKKPWKQKGTGRARHGSIRSPLWKGGGVTFGPRSNRNFFKKVNKKVKKAAIRMILSSKLAENRVILVQDLDMEAPKTKSVNSFLQAIPKQGYRTLFFAPKEAANFQLSARNLPDVQVLRTDNINVYDLLKAHTLVLPVSELAKIEQVFSPLMAKAV